MSFIRPKAAYLDTEVGLAHYVYHGEMQGEALYPYDAYLRWSRGFSLGQWHRIDQFVQMNTPGAHDGVLRGLVDGELVLDRDGMLFRAENAGDVHIEEFVKTVYFGASGRLRRTTRCTSTPSRSRWDRSSRRRWSGRRDSRPRENPARSASHSPMSRSSAKTWSSYRMMYRSAT